MTTTTTTQAPQSPLQAGQTSPQSSVPPPLAATTSPGMTFSDDQYEQFDSDAEAEAEIGTSRDTLHEGQIVKSGYLAKKGERLKIWRKRWFVLRTSKFAYYKDSKEYELLRIVDLRDIHRAAEVESKNKVGVFVLITPKRTFTLQAENAAAMHAWIDAINSAKAQYEMNSSSDIDTFVDTTPQSVNVEQQQRPGWNRQGSNNQLIVKRLEPTPLSLSDPGLLSSGARSGPPSALASPVSPGPRISFQPNLPKSSGISQGLQQSHSAGFVPVAQHPSSLATNAGLAHNSAPAPKDDVAGIVTGTQGIRISTSPKREDGSEYPPNSYSSNHSFNHMPGTPSSPGCYSNSERYGCAEANASSEEEEIGDDPIVVEAGRVAAEANAPGSGIVTTEQMESQVIRQGYLLKMNSKYKEYQPHGIIPLSTIIDSLQGDPISKSKQYCMRIVTAKRTFVCCAPDEDTLLQWLDALHVACERVAQEERLEEEYEAAQRAATGATTAAAGGGNEQISPRVRVVGDSSIPISTPASLPRANSSPTAPVGTLQSASPPPQSVTFAISTSPTQISPVDP
ncbi:hypothetical protein DFQ27_009645 [Actinomortierella ambigua]|uniref:PH domain-containing protein n=1 Tax=Actinomortierella ambigua TaxID=1343610 RepID=A0A9P6PPM2_9FUNG|nr:hypothetical protein DFQ27_009645 [Actinomortierella ambigua]